MSELKQRGYIIQPMEPIIEEILRDFRLQQDENVMRAVGEVGIHVDKPRLLQALTDASAFYEEGYRAAMRSIVHCLYCEHYEHGKCHHPRHNHVQSIEQDPTDFCSYGRFREDRP